MRSLSKVMLYVVATAVTCGATAFAPIASAAPALHTVSSIAGPAPMPHPTPPPAPQPSPTDRQVVKPPRPPAPKPPGPP
jgi:hypothetical protein